MRIAYLHQQGININDLGGGIVHIKAIVQNLRKAGHDTSFLTLDLPNFQVIQSTDMVDFSSVKLSLSNSRSFRIIESGIRRFQGLLHLPYFAFIDSIRFYDGCVNNLIGYDIIHERFNMVGIGGVFAAKRLCIPYILEVNADYFVESEISYQNLRGTKRVISNLTSKLCFQQANLIIAVSNQLRTHMVHTWNIPENKIVVLKNGVDIHKFQPQPDPDRVRKKLGLGDYPIIVFVGKFFPWHATIDLVDSFHLVRHQIADTRLFMIGDGPTRYHTKARAQQLGINSAVNFIGNIPHAQVMDWLAVADVAVAPYPKLNRDLWFSPLKIFEYMAAGKAIVASRSGQVVELIEHDRNGLLFDPGNIEQLAQVLVELIEDPEKRKRLGANARQQAVNQHSWEKHITDLVDLYTCVIQK